MKTFKLEIVTPETFFPPRDVISVDVQAAEGRLTILSGHAPLICSLSRGDTRLRLDDQSEETWATGPGTMTVDHNRVSLLVKSATQSR